MTDVEVPQPVVLLTSLVLISSLIVHILTGSADTGWEISRVAKSPIYHYFDWCEISDHNFKNARAMFFMDLKSAELYKTRKNRLNIDKL